MRDKRQESIDKTSAAVDAALMKPSVHGQPRVVRISGVQALLDQTAKNLGHVVDNLEAGKISFAEFREVLAHALGVMPVSLALMEHKG